MEQERTIRNSLILVVDDNLKNLQLMGTLLKENNFKVSIANGGHKALQMADKLMPDLILLDVMMPEIDGYEVCRRLKQNASTESIPVIFLTAKVETEDIVKGFRVGGVDYVTKPANREELLARINTHLELKRSREIIKEQNEALTQSNEKLKELNNTKDKFFSIIAHDLKNPLGSFKGLAEVLYKEYDSFSYEEARDAIRMMYSASDRVYALLENLLEWARVQTGKIACHPERFNLRRIAEDSLIIVSAASAKKNIVLDDRVDPELQVYADPNIITAVVRNLISNAIKFTPNGGKIIVDANVRGGLCTVGILDTGVGMNEETLAGLFKIESNRSNPGTENEKGTGLGLILSREFVALNKGEIWAESKPGEGSSFYFTIPCSE